ncbi:transcriptional regulator [Lonsdalea britannica]|uniref:Transcriptional regulator n=1 Tax=Lonsdalea britannica TaxID=1082704 RepID=A0AAD0SFN5_9GAMM|nr:transcriptional regulator [Lonsdalea britannica]AXW86999.1 transcriptional regulator [Lonsdalea britannica]OSM99312.1 transcriptional regulator [Lonsdalea britannica]OSN08839.1 transcriptional regulator [Lonsdalea britannica]
MSLIFGRNDIIGILSTPIHNDRRAVAIIDEKCKVLCANAAFNAHFGLRPNASNPASIDEILPINVQFAFQDFIADKHMLSTHVSCDLLADGFMKKPISTLTFSKLNVESRVLSLIILNHGGVFLKPGLAS